MEIFIEQDQVAPVWIGLKFLGLSIHGPATLGIAQEDVAQAVLVTMIAALLEHHVGFRSLGDGAIDTTASGELVFHIVSALAQFGRRLIQERTRAGLAAARARGKKGGRKPLQPAEPRVRMASTLYADQHLTVPDICQTLRISPGTFYRYVALSRRTAEETERLRPLGRSR